MKEGRRPLSDKNQVSVFRFFSCGIQVHTRRLPAQKFRVLHSDSSYHIFPFFKSHFFPISRYFHGEENQRPDKGKPASSAGFRRLFFDGIEAYSSPRKRATEMTPRGGIRESDRIES